MQLLKYLKSKIFIRTIITMLVVFIVGIFLVMKFLSYKTNHDQKIEVPDLAKMGLAEADKTLDDLDLDFVVIDSASFKSEYPPKSIIEQNPEAGDFVKEGRKIYLTLNPSSYRKIVVPNVLGKTKRQVVTQLTSAGFKIGGSSYIPDIGRDVVRKLQFNGKELTAGMAIPKNSAIDLVLGDGKGRSSSNDSNN